MDSHLHRVPLTGTVSPGRFGKQDVSVIHDMDELPGLAPGAAGPLVRRRRTARQAEPVTRLPEVVGLRAALPPGGPAEHVVVLQVALGRHASGIEDQTDIATAGA